MEAKIWMKAGFWYKGWQKVALYKACEQSFPFIRHHAICWTTLISEQQSANIYTF